MMKIIIFAMALVVAASTVASAGCTNMKRLPVFNYKKHATGEADFSGLSRTSRTIVIRHTTGISSIAIDAKRGAKGQYRRGGKGAPLPVGVRVSANQCKAGKSRLYNRKLHARLKTNYQTQFVAPFLSPRNRNQAVALAKTVLRATYCPKGEIKLDPNFRYVDSKGTNPVVRTAKAVQPWDKGFEDTWNIRFTCSEWRAAK